MYNPERIKEAIQQVKQFSITCTHKGFHLSRVFEMQNMIDSFGDINNIYFNTAIARPWGFSQYYEMAARQFKETKKSKMDAWLKIAKEQLIKDLNEMLAYAQTDE